MGVELGRLMSAEMNEQPTVLSRLADQFPDITGQVRAVRPARPGGVAFLARGSSDNAALLGRYLVERDHGLPTCLVAPSIATAYRRPLDGFAGWIVVAVSQSGRTPEIVDLAGRFRAAGAVVLGISNDDESDLAAASSLSIGLGAGPERAVPATKTVTAQMLAMLAVAGGLGDAAGSALGPGEIGYAVAEVLQDRDAVEAAAAAIDVDRMAVVARGLCLAAATESSLKLQETTAMMAHGFSTADFRHGPIAVCGPRTPALLIAGSGPADADTLALRDDLAARGARSVVVGTTPDADVPLPEGEQDLECVLATVRGQQFALALSQRRGIDPDAPSGLRKITPTQ
ncbi:SIS domain-containing protein [Pseudonocardia sp. MH-G8]|uniref:SIS domain-containing protein n=1 Tax=Pseudonocardia sp. MH-G8 TaxID=1854588 RepID=UPI000BA0E406|nr:SIS domain-containing protein [Pseudonocardia sp. MH-G8]OZM75465.1 glutamine--fructose-6-phosphate aminotransferase [Pseudonocardia sp. MH-G8]